MSLVQIAQIRVLTRSDNDDYDGWCKVVNLLAMELKANKIEYLKPSNMVFDRAIIHYFVDGSES